METPAKQPLGGGCVARTVVSTCMHACMKFVDLHTVFIMYMSIDTENTYTDTHYLFMFLPVILLSVVV